MRSDPLILAFDTSAAHCAAALLCGEAIVAQAAEPMTRGQAERLMPLLAELLHQGGADWPDLAAVGVGIGPGNFTGARIAVSAARGLALGLGVPAVGVSGLEAQTWGITGPGVSVLPAPRERVYVQDLGGKDPVRLCALEADALPRLGPEAVCVGEAAPAVVALAGGRAQAPQVALAEGVARLAQARLGGAVARPAPLYVRPADAAPARDAPPVILP